MRITEGHLARHYQGRRGGRGPALLDIGQDHALAHLHRVIRQVCPSDGRRWPGHCSVFQVGPAA